MCAPLPNGSVRRRATRRPSHKADTGMPSAHAPIAGRGKPPTALRQGSRPEALGARGRP